MAAKSTDLEEVLKPFYQRASEAEERLARLEASVKKDKDSGNEEQFKLVSEVESEIEKLKNEREREKQSLTAENAKLQYRIIHLVRALNEADNTTK